MDAFRYALDPPVPVVIVFCLALAVLLRRYLARENFHALMFGLIVAFGLAEGICRALNVGSPDVVMWKEDRAAGRELPYPYEPGGKLVYRYPDNPRGYFDQNNEVKGTINSKGFRGQDTDFVKENGKVRVAFLGDSFTLGIGVKDEDTLPYRVEMELKKHDRNIEVLNFGVSGHDPAAEVRLLEQYVLKFDPDIVVIVLFLNDADRTATIRFLSRPVILARVRQYSYSIGLLVGSIERIRLSRMMVRHYQEGFLDSSPGYQAVKSSLREGRLLSEKHGFSLVVALYPVLFRLDDGYPFRNIHRQIGDFCREEKIAFVDLFPAFEGKRDKEMWVHPTDQHPNETAHRLADRELADYILREGILEAVRK